MSDEPREELMEAVVSAHRQRDAEGRPIPPPEWWDLPPEALDEAHQRQMESRRLERAADPQGRSSTVKAVLERTRASE